MIQEGTDGELRGEIHLNSLLNSAKNQVPLGDQACVRSKSLVPWLESWMEGGFKICTPGDWFHSGTQAIEYAEPRVSQTRIWDLPSAAALHAFEELAIGCFKGHPVLHKVVMVPSLMKPIWFRHFIHTLDCYFTVPAGWCDMVGPIICIKLSLLEFISFC
jgi:hypothetical protein